MLIKVSYIGQVVPALPWFPICGQLRNEWQIDYRENYQIRYCFVVNFQNSAQTAIWINELLSIKNLKLAMRQCQNAP